MYEENHAKGLEIAGITRYYGYYAQERQLTPDAEFAKMESFKTEHGLPWPIIFGEAENFEAYGVGGIPQYVVIDRAGKVKSITIGYNEELHKQLEKDVKEALAESAAAQ